MRVFRSIPVLVVMLSLSACTRVGTAPMSPPVPTPAPAPEQDIDRDLQVFGGKVTMGGQDLSLVLELRVAESTYRHAKLRVPDLPIEARGGGTIDGDLMVLDLSYGNTCKGAARLEGRMEADGTRVRGTLVAKDCTGSAEGDLVLLLRPNRDVGGKVGPSRLPRPR